MEKGYFLKKNVYMYTTESLCYTAVWLNTVDQIYFYNKM